VPTNAKILQTVLPTVSLKPSSLDSLQTDSPTVSRKPSNILTASTEPAEPTIKHQSTRPSVSMTPSHGSFLAYPAQTMTSFSPTVSLNPSDINGMTTSVPTNAKLLQTDLPPLSLQPSSLDVLQTDSPTISRKPSNVLTASVQTKKIHQSSHLSVSITPSDGFILANPAQMMTSLMPTVSLTPSHTNSLITSVPTNAKILHTVLPTVSLKPSSLDSLQTDSPTVSRKPSNILTASTEPAVSTIKHQSIRPSVSMKPSDGSILANPAPMMTSFLPTVSLKPSNINGLTTSLPTNAKLLQTDLPSVSVQPSSLGLLQTDSPTISRKPSNFLKASTEPAEPTIKHQSIRPSVSMTPSDGSILANPAQSMTSLSPTVSLKPSDITGLTTSLPTNSKLLQTDLPSISLQPSSLDLLQTDSPTISRKPSNFLKASAEPTIIHQSSNPSVRNNWLRVGGLLETRYNKLSKLE
jgi:hypothetical protein